MNGLMEWLLVLASLIGVYLNIHKRPECFYVWGAVAIAWGVVDLRHGIYSQASLQVIYFLSSIYGLSEWKKSGRTISQEIRPDPDCLSAPSGRF